VPLPAVDDVPLHAIQTNVDATMAAAPTEKRIDVRDTMEDLRARERDL
jgi:hypothetical protein